MFHKVKSVTPMQDMVLLVHFAEGQAKRYDVKPLLDRLPPFRSLADVKGLFDQVRVDAGGYGVSWNDDLDLSCDGGVFPFHQRGLSGLHINGFHLCVRYIAPVIRGLLVDGIVAAVIENEGNTP